MDNNIFINSFIGTDEDEISLETVKEQHDPKAKRVVVHINSNGGDVKEGKAIYDFLRELKQPVHTVGEGMVASIATLPFLAGATREMKPNCEFLGHLPSAVAEGNSDDIARLNTYMQKTKRDLAAIYAEFTGKELSDMIEFMRTDTPISAEKAKAMGFVTEIPEFKAVARYDVPAPEQSAYEKTVAKMMSGIDDILKAITTPIKGSVHDDDEDKEILKNVTVELKDGSFIFVESDDGELEGKRAWIADAEGNATEEAVVAGDYDLQDGRVLTVGDDGIVESVSEAAAEDSEEVEALKTQLAKADSKNEELKVKLKAQEDAQKVMVDEVKNLKEMVLGELPVVAKAIVDPNKLPKAHRLDGFAARLKQSKQE